MPGFARFFPPGGGVAGVARVYGRLSASYRRRAGVGRVMAVIIRAEFPKKFPTSLAPGEVWWGRVRGLPELQSPQWECRFPMST